MINEVLARYSNVAIYSAMFVLVLALFAFSLHLAARTKRLPSQAEAEAASATRSGARPARAREAAVGADGSEAGGSVAVLVDERSDGDALDPDNEGVALSSVSPRARKLAAMGVYFSYIATVCLVVAVALRGLSVHRAPMGNLFEYCVAGCAAAMLVYSSQVRRRQWEWLGPFLTGLVLVVLMLAVKQFYVDPGQLMPALRSVWLGIHVTIATCALGFFTVGFALSMLQIWQRRREAAAAEGATVTNRFAFMSSIPGSASLERAAYGMNIVGFILWTFTLITGAIWAQKAWGAYWQWDPKEVATFVIWVVYAAYLHARVTAGWESRRATWIGIVGYVCVILNFTVVNLSSAFAGMHNYSGM